MVSDKARQQLDWLHEQTQRIYSITPRTPSKDDEDLRTWVTERILGARTDGLSADTAERLRNGLPGAMARLHAQGKTETISQYESPLLISLLAGLANEMEEAAQRHGFDLPERPLFATLPTGRIETTVIAVKDTNEHLVLFESEFFMFAHTVSQAVAEVLPYTENEDGGVTFSPNPGEVVAHVERRPEITRRFGELVLSYLKTGQPGLAPWRVQDRIPGVLADCLRGSVEMFALGHEYGHLLKGHLGTRSPMLRLGGTGSGTGEDDPEEILYGQAQEIEADIEGLQLMLPARQRHWGLALSYAGADLYFTMIDVFHRAVSLLRYGEEGKTSYTTHPAPADRREILRFALAKSAPDDRGETALGLAKNIEAIVEMLWSRLQPGLLDAHRAGARPLGLWQD
jgi:hypothetical protein